LFSWCSRPGRFCSVGLRKRGNDLTQGDAAVLLVGVLASAWATESIGIHALFGAFLFGAVIPHRCPAARQMESRLRDLVTCFCCLLFRVYWAADTHRPGGRPGSVVVVRCDRGRRHLGKFGGTVAAARMTGSGWRDAAALGTLMNTRGLMELVVLKHRPDLG